MQVFPAQLFCWIAQERTFVGEMSELSHHTSGGVERTFQILNQKTGGRCTFALDHIDRDDEGETTAWVYMSEHNDPKRRGLKATIFND